MVLEEFLMWNKNKSIMLTQLIVRACYVIFAAALIAIPFALNWGFIELSYMRETIMYVICSLLAVAPAGYVALICLDKLLINVKREMVFNEKNVKLLRIISWACFYAGLVGVVLFIILCIKVPFLPITIFPLAVLALAIAEMFMGLVVRVVKNVFEAAIEIKEENELTI